MQHPVTFADLSPQLSKILSPGAPAPIKLMAADGMAPLPTGDLLIALYALAYDADEKVSHKARATVGNLPESVLGGALEQVTRQEVLDGLAPLLAGRPTMLHKVLLNKSLADETAVMIARSCNSEDTLEMIAANETRMLACPAIIEALYHNKKARMSTVDRAVELAVRAGIELLGIPSFEQIKAALTGGTAPSEAGPEPALVDDELHASLLEEAAEEIDEATVSAILESNSTEQPIETPEETQKKVESLMKTLSKLNICSKIRLATLGNASQRAMLIRDSNKLVIMAVVQSPGIRDSEVMLYSRYRTLPEDAVRFIARNREWTKHYTVKLNLAQNPRTPLEFALRFLPHLRANDLRAIERDKNVSGAVAKAAKELRSKRSN
ncbi:MAG: hypothetical protein MUC50_00605 [Myxococcota bacterium]|jgi:hypothetical protein|nr:hypothetical protein [Myxococcota bacterium]